MFEDVEVLMLDQDECLWCGSSKKKEGRRERNGRGKECGEQT